VPYRKLHRLVDERRPELITPPDWLLGEPCPNLSWLNLVRTWVMGRVAELCARSRKSLA
jgi:hypothetical protein